MTETIVQKTFATFEEYLNYDDETDVGCELVDGELVPLPPESEYNNSIANYLFLVLVNMGVPFRLVRPHGCEIQIPRPGQKPQSRYPDLAILREEHLELTQTRLTISIEMPPPCLVAEVVSPGRDNRERDYILKRAEYEAVGIPEYWIIDPHQQTVTVLRLESGSQIVPRPHYVEVGVFREDDEIVSATFPQLHLTASQLLQLN